MAQSQPLSDPALARLRHNVLHLDFIPSRIVRQLLARFDQEHAELLTLRARCGGADTSTTMASGGALSPAEGQRP